MCAAPHGSQTMAAAMHALRYGHVHTWGTCLRMYVVPVAGSAKQSWRPQGIFARSVFSWIWAWNVLLILHVCMFKIAPAQGLSEGRALSKMPIYLWALAGPSLEDMKAACAGGSGIHADRERLLWGAVYGCQSAAAGRCRAADMMGSLLSGLLGTPQLSELFNRWASCLRMMAYHQICVLYHWPHAPISDVDWCLGAFCSEQCFSMQMMLNLCALAMSTRIELGLWGTWPQFLCRRSARLTWQPLDAGKTWRWACRWKLCSLEQSALVVSLSTLGSWQWTVQLSPAGSRWQPILETSTLWRWPTRCSPRNDRLWQFWLGRLCWYARPGAGCSASSLQPAPVWMVWLQ